MERPLKLNRYEKKILTAAAAGKCGGDLAAIYGLQRHGFLKIEVRPGELNITITDAGRRCLAQQ
jgi:hypothetical protein